MKSTLLSILFLLGIGLATATDLQYKWKAGSIYRFKMNQVDNVSMSTDIMGMKNSLNDIYKTDLVFALKVNSVSPNGTADALLYIEQFKTINKAGKVIASLVGIPKAALSSPVEVDRKGKFTYKKMVYMIVQDNATIVVTGKATNNEVSASGTGPDGTQLSVNAEFDPKTGTLKAGYSVTNVGTPKTKTIQVKEDATELDLLPYDFLEVFQLPEGDVTVGQSTVLNSMGMELNVTLVSFAADVATINCKFKSDMKASMNTDGKTEIKGTDGEENNMDMNMNNSGTINGNMGGMNMNSMGMGNMDMGTGNTQMGMSEQDKAMIPDAVTKGNITVSFNNAKGMFGNLKGDITSTQESTGIKSEVKSTIVLTALP